jgi:hypothetical protein
MPLLGVTAKKIYRSAKEADDPLDSSTIRVQFNYIEALREGASIRHHDLPIEPSVSMMSIYRAGSAYHYSGE